MPSLKTPEPKWLQLLRHRVRFARTQHFQLPTTEVESLLAVLDERAEKIEELSKDNDQLNIENEALKNQTGFP